MQPHSVSRVRGEEEFMYTARVYVHACMFVRLIVRVCACHVMVLNFRQGQTPYIALRL